MQQSPAVVFLFSLPLAAQRSQASQLVPFTVAAAGTRMRGPGEQLRCCGTYCCQG